MYEKKSIIKNVSSVKFLVSTIGTVERNTSCAFSRGSRPDLVGSVERGVLGGRSRELRTFSLLPSVHNRLSTFSRCHRSREWPGGGCTRDVALDCTNYFGFSFSQEGLFYLYVYIFFFIKNRTC